MRSVLLGSSLALLALAAGCQSTGPFSDQGELPPGPGLVTSDRTVPAGVSAHEAPSWVEGDRFVYLKAGQARLPLRVLAADDSGARMLDEESGRILFVGGEQLERGQSTPEGEREFELDPGDHLVAWPLWSGKRWTSQFVSRAPTRPDLPLIASYHCDGTEVVTVPAGSFECLRIWRRLRVAAEGDFPERVSLFWYAPEVGAFVRRLDNGLVTELVEYHRQR